MRRRQPAISPSRILNLRWGSPTFRSCRHLELPCFLAGKAFTQYRRAGGIRTGVLADFFIGAHAAVEELPLLTRDSRRYRHYFPTVVLITPENERKAAHKAHPRRQKKERGTTCRWSPS